MPTREKTCEQAVKHEEKSPRPSPFIDETIEIRNLQLRGRQRRVMKHFSIQTVGDLLAFNPHRATRVAGAGNKTVQELLNLQSAITAQGTDFLQSVMIKPPAPTSAKTNQAPDYTEVHTLLESLFHTLISSDRNRQIIRRRLGLAPKKNENKRPTLDTLSGEFSLTRERIRQISQESLACLQGPETLKILAPFWEKVEGHLNAHNGFRFIDPLFEDIKAEFGWRDSSRQSFATLLSFHHDLVVDTESNTVSRIGCPCLSCEAAQSFVAGVLDTETESDAMALSDVGRALMHHCHARCPKGGKPQAPFNPPFIRFLAAGIPSVDVLDDCLVSRYRLLLERGGNTRELAYQILRKAGHPLHFREVAEIIRKKSNVESMNSVTDNSVHAVLVRSDEFRCTARGTYGLSTWNIKEYMSHGKAIIQLLEQTGRAMTAREIIKELTRDGEFRTLNIRAALRSHSRFKLLADDRYSLAD